MARLYRDILGKLNQGLTLAADEVYLMVAGLSVLIKPCPP
jgi:adenosyl cobinamide kinase/adenosyl cobinamide phosphate guanylyltransferase